METTTTLTTLNGKQIADLVWGDAGLLAHPCLVAPRTGFDELDDDPALD
jgi:hypothetical protein